MSTGNQHTRKCPDCKCDATLYTGDKHRYFGCTSCGSYFKNDGDVWTKVKKHEVPSQKAVSIGMKVKLDGIEYTIISQTEKAITGSIFSWTEFLLYHPQHPVASLSENAGHWHFFTPGHFAVGFGATNVKYQDRNFKLYSKDEVHTVNAVGEFPAAIHLKSSYLEFIDPPNIISREKYDDTIETYYGRYIEPEELKAGCPEMGRAPWRRGVGAAQTFKSAISAKELFRYYLIFVSVLLAIFVFQSLHQEQKVSMQYEVHPKNFEIKSELSPPDTVVSKYKVSDGFTIEKNHTPVLIEVSCPAVNTWVTSENILLNEDTGEEITVWQDVEFYTGYDEGTWTEGSHNSSKIVSDLSAGKYKILSRAEGPVNETYPVSMLASVNPPLYSNFFLFLIVGSILPILFWYREKNFETKRWNNSDYEP